MTSFSGSPRLQKGAIIGLDPLNSMASVIVFQYNPETLSRTLNIQAGGTNKGEALRLSGPPEETISLDLIFDAADQLEQAKFPATSMGVYPALASLEMLLYPKSTLVIANEVLSALGIIEIVPPEAPLTLFVWGAKRVLPVRITQFSITEESFDPNLNPIHAKVKLTLHVLNYQDLGMLSFGGSLFVAHQVVKEVMATIGSAGNISSSFSLSGGV